MHAAAPQSASEAPFCNPSCCKRSTVGALLATMHRCIACKSQIKLTSSDNFRIPCEHVGDECPASFERAMCT